MSENNPLGQGQKDQVVRKEVVIEAPVSRVWKALTDKEHMKQWGLVIAEFEPEVGFEFEFEGGTEGRVYRHLCKVTEVIPEKKLAYTWRYDGYPGDSLVTFELFAERDKTRLKLTHSGVDSFATAHPDLSRDNFDKGWTDIVHVLIKNFVEEKD